MQGGVTYKESEFVFQHGFSLVELVGKKAGNLKEFLKCIKKMHYQVFTESQRNVTRLLSTFIFMAFSKGIYTTSLLMIPIISPRLPALNALTAS